jgi:hypothetical protein
MSTATAVSANDTAQSAPRQLHAPRRTVESATTATESAGARAPTKGAMKPTHWASLPTRNFTPVGDHSGTPAQRDVWRRRTDVCTPSRDTDSGGNWHTHSTP